MITILIVGVLAGLVYSGLALLLQWLACRLANRWGLLLATIIAAALPLALITAVVTARRPLDKHARSELASPETIAKINSFVELALVVAALTSLGSIALACGWIRRRRP